MEQATHPATVPVEIPLGNYTTRVDGSGRVKLPAVFQNYVSNLSEKTLFVTSLDGCQVELYTLPAWRVAEKKLLATKGTGKQLLMVAGHLGSMVEMDSQGRVSLNSTLRAALNIGEEPLYLYKFREHIRLEKEASYNARLAAIMTPALQKIADDAFEDELP